MIISMAESKWRKEKENNLESKTASQEEKP